MRRRQLLCVGLAVAATAITAGAVNAQAGGLVGGATGTVKDTTGSVKDTVGNTVKDTTGTVKDTTGTVKNTAGNAVGTVTGGGGSGGGGSTTTTGTTPPPSGSGSGTGTTGTTGTGTTGGGGAGSTGGAAGPGGRRATGGNAHGGGHGRNGGTAMPSHPMAMSQGPQQKPNGVPTKFNPSLSVATPTPSPFGAAPSFMVGQFEIPPFLLPIYQACGSQYGIPWEVLASINKIETAFGTNLNISSAGAEGWMQFMPATWKTWGIDANGDGRADPFNPVDAICSAARYLQASGGDTNLRQAIFAYNHASWYVDEVVATAQQYGRLPDELVGSLTGLTAGDRFPIAAKSRYAEPSGTSPVFAAQGAGAGGPGNALAKFGGGPVRLNPGVNMTVGQEPQIREALSALAAEIGKPVYVISGYRSPAHSVAVGGFADDPHTKGIAADIGVGAPTRDSVASVTDAQLREVGLFRPFSAPSEINHVQLLYGADSTSGSAQGINIFSQEGAPVVAVNDGTIKAIGHTKNLGNYVVLKDDYGNKFIYWDLGSIRPAKKQASKNRGHGKQSKGHGHSGSGKKQTAVSRSQPSQRRLYALPQRANNVSNAALAGQLQPNPLTASANDMSPSEGSRPRQAAGALHRGSRVSAGTLLGRVGKTDGLAPHINFAIQPTGIGTGSVDPKPILDGWQLLHETAAYSAGQNPLRSVAKPSDAINDLLMPSSALAHRALSDPRLDIYRCGRMDIRSGQIDRRVLATINFLADNGFRLSIDSLKCDPNAQASSTGSSKDPSQIVAEHSSGDAVAISKVDGLSLAGHQGPGTPAEALIKTVIGQQGVMEPDQVTSQEDLPGPVSSSVSGSRGDRIDIGFTPLKGGSTYQSPFEHAIKGRIDQGVDYVGRGPINAIGNARILRVGSPGWPNGGAGPAGQGVLYKLLDGPQQGSNIFVYEGLTPTVKAGDEVVAGQQIATFYPGSSIEIGFADSAGTPLAHEHYTEGKVTGWGKRMDSFLSSVGAPGKLDHQFAQMLSPQEWNRVIQQMKNISNPTVKPGPSHTEAPSGPHDSGTSGPTGPGK